METAAKAIAADVRRMHVIRYVTTIMCISMTTAEEILVKIIAVREIIARKAVPTERSPVCMSTLYLRPK